jgi:hypothetical protein
METNGATALAIVPTQPQASASTALEPSTAEQAFWLATQLVKSGVLGRSVQKPEAAFAIILAGRELGLTAMQSLRSLHIIEGKVVLSADLMAALVVKSPLCEYFQMVESTNSIARYVAKRVRGKETPMSFSMEDAKLAGVTGKNNWKTYPAAMLRARCIAALARVVFPDLLLGVYDNDEIQTASTMPSAREAGPTDPIEPPAEPDEGQEHGLVELWGARLKRAETVEALDAVRAECKAEVADRATLNAIGKVYAERKAALVPPTENPKEN